jgi:hypothetical protein
VKYVETPQFKDCILALYMALTKEYCFSFEHVINPRKNALFNGHEILLLKLQFSAAREDMFQRGYLLQKLMEF